MRKLIAPVHSVVLKHTKYCGRIQWDATDDPIQFLVEIAKKKKSVPRRMKVPIIATEDGDILGTIDLGNVSPLVIAKLNFEKDHEEFEENFYHPDFPKCVQELVLNMLKEDGILRKRLEDVLSS